MARRFSLSSDIQLAALWNQLSGQFRSLDLRQPETWPASPRYLLLLSLSLMVLAGLWFVWLSGVEEELQLERTRETQLRQDFRNKLAKAASLELLKKQREQVINNVKQLEKQLPSKAEMDALLSDINQAGLGRSLQFELFRPGQVVVKDYYAELPIALRVIGRYHDIGAFTSDIAHLSRIVTLNTQLTIVPGRDDILSMDATARTYRYLDAQEIEAQRKVSAAKGGRK
ncbi:MAG: type 4a pilus biogenesis protein PilO [Hylemonella sp.]|jgi:type IV pilus assembly protein PilO